MATTSPSRSDSSGSSRSLPTTRMSAVVGTWGWRIGTNGQELGVFDVGPRDAAHFRELRDQDATIYLLALSVVLSTAAALAVGGFRDGLFGAEDIDLWTRLPMRMSSPWCPSA